LSVGGLQQAGCLAQAFRVFRSEDAHHSSKGVGVGSSRERALGLTWRDAAKGPVLQTKVRGWTEPEPKLPWVLGATRTATACIRAYGEDAEARGGQRHPADHPGFQHPTKHKATLKPEVQGHTVSCQAVSREGRGEPGVQTHKPLFSVPEPRTIFNRQIPIFSPPTKPDAALRRLQKEGPRHLQSTAFLSLALLGNQRGG
jgi:hypothetical protein